MKKLIIVSFFALKVFSSQTSPALADNNANVTLPNTDNRVIAYSKSFAHRFGLPMPKPEYETSGGLEAIEFNVEKITPWSETFASCFKLYIDGNVSIEYPEEGAQGNVSSLITKSHFFGDRKEQFDKWNKADKIYIGEKHTRYSRTAVVSTMNYEFGKKGASNPLWVYEYRTDLFKNLNYIRLYGFGKPFDIHDDSGIGIWIKKKGAVDYRKKIAIDSSQFNKFALPIGFIKDINKLQDSVQDNEKHAHNKPPS